MWWWSFQKLFDNRLDFAKENLWEWYNWNMIFFAIWLQFLFPSHQGIVGSLEPGKIIHWPHTSFLLQISLEGKDISTFMLACCVTAVLLGIVLDLSSLCSLLVAAAAAVPRHHLQHPSHLLCWSFRMLTTDLSLPCCWTSRRSRKQSRWSWEKIRLVIYSRCLSVHDYGRPM